MEPLGASTKRNVESGGGSILAAAPATLTDMSGQDSERAAATLTDKTLKEDART